MLHDKAMIANLNIRSWTARKHDRAISDEVDSNHGAKDGGRYNKLLIDKAALDPLAKHAGQTRDYHYKMTLPWGDNGDRLLPAQSYLEYTKAMRSYKNDGETLTRTFVAAYPNLVADARGRLGTLYDASDYPPVSDIAGRFGVNVGFLPVPDAKDFRVDVGDEALAEIKRSINDSVAERQAGAVKECWTRLNDVVGKLHVMMLKDKPIFRDSIVSNVTDLIELLPKLNITNDKALNEACKFCHVPESPAELRKHPGARAHLAAKTADMLRMIAGHL